MLEQTASICLMVLFVCILLNLVRVIVGPSPADRALAADTIYMNIIGVAATYSIILKTPSYLDLVLVFSLLGFVGTVCFAKYLAKGRIIQ